MSAVMTDLLSIVAEIVAESLIDFMKIGEKQTKKIVLTRQHFSTQTIVIYKVSWLSWLPII